MLCLGLAACRSHDSDAGVGVAGDTGDAPQNMQPGAPQAFDGSALTLDRMKQIVTGAGYMIADGFSGLDAPDAQGGFTVTIPLYADSRQFPIVDCGSEDAAVKAADRINGGGQLVALQYGQFLSACTPEVNENDMGLMLALILVGDPVDLATMRMSGEAVGFSPVTEGDDPAPPLYGFTGPLQSSLMTNDATSASGSASGGGSSGSSTQWPTSDTYHIPEWLGITTFYGHSPGALDDYARNGNAYYIHVEATPDSLSRYIGDLEAAGWAVGEAYSPDGYSARLGPVSMTITHPKTSDTKYDIDITLSPIGSWPVDVRLPGFITQLAGKSLLYDPNYYPPGSDYEWLADNDGYNFFYTYTGLTQDEGIAYMKAAASKLQNGVYSPGGVDEAFGNIKGTYDIDGVTYNVSGEITQEDSQTYDFDFGWSTGTVY